MKYTVLLHRYMNGQYDAVVPAVPAFIGKGRTREEALKQLKDNLQTFLHSTEITTIDLDIPKSEHNPWIAAAGMFKNDPMLQPMLDEIYALRNLKEASE